MTQDRVTEERLREMLAGCVGVTPGPWQVYDGSSWRRIGTTGRHYDDCAVLYPNVASDGHLDMHAGRGQNTYANLNHIAACDPQTITSLITELLELRSRASRVPEGWVMVPPEVTLDMQKAYFDVIDKNMPRVEKDLRFGRFASNREAYRAMIAAAPASPDTQTQENDG